MRKLDSKRNSTSNDPFGFMYNFHWFLFHHRIMRKITGLSFCLFISTTVVGIVSVVCSLGVSALSGYMLQIAVAPWVSSTCLLAYLELVPIIDTHSLPNREEFWDLSTMDNKYQITTRRDIRKKVMPKIIMGLTYINAILVSFILPLLFDEDSVMIDTYIVKNYFFALRRILLPLMYLTRFVIILSGADALTIAEYYVYTMKLQMEINIAFLKQTEQYKESEQLAIKKHLRFGIEHHIQMNRILETLQRLGYIINSMFPISGTAGLCGCLVFFYFNHGPVNTVRVLMYSTMVFLIFLESCENGQRIEDAFSEFHDGLLALDWIEWNTSNRRTLMVMIVRLQRPAVLSFINIVINRTLIIQILKVVYQTFLVLQRTI